MFNSNSITFWVCGSLQVPQPPWTETAMILGRCSPLGGALLWCGSNWYVKHHSQSVQSKGRYYYRWNHLSRLCLLRQTVVLFHVKVLLELDHNFLSWVNTKHHLALLNTKHHLALLPRCRIDIFMPSSQEPFVFPSLCIELTQHQISLAKNKVLNCFPSQLVITVCVLLIWFIGCINHVHHT